MNHFIPYLMGILVGASVSAAIMDRYLHSNDDVVAHNCAHYDSKTGDFTWNDEVKP